MTVIQDDNVPEVKLQELRCFEAVVRLGSFQAAGQALNRSHPSVFAAVARLEAAYGVTLLDRSGYRVQATPAGALIHDRITALLQETEALGRYARRLGLGAEPVLRIVIGDLCPRAKVLPFLSAFFAAHPGTRLELDYEAVAGPAERLRRGTADFAFHRADASDAALEQIDMGTVRLVPVAAPGLLPFLPDHEATPERLRPFTQCVIRDTAREGRSEDHFLIDGAPRCSVPDHAMKRELILQGLGWGHLPDFMVEGDVHNGRLLDLGSPALPGRVERLAALRRSDHVHGPVASALWRALTLEPWS